MCNGLVIKIMWLHVCKLSTNGAGAHVSIWYLELLSKWIMSANCCQGFAVRFLTTTITLNIRPLGKQLLVLSTSSPESGSIFSIFPLPCCMGLADSHASKECARQPLIYNHEFCLQMFSFTEKSSWCSQEANKDAANTVKVTCSFHLKYYKNFFKYSHIAKNNPSELPALPISYTLNNKF